jgi:hypothetical protein
MQYFFEKKYANCHWLSQLRNAKMKLKDFFMIMLHLRARILSISAVSETGTILKLLTIVNNLVKYLFFWVN